MSWHASPQPRRNGPHTGFSRRLAAALAQGAFIPSHHGALSHGYDLWATHANGDVILHCGGNAGWFDWFRPVQPGEDPDFVLTIAGTAYRLVRGVDVIPEGFAMQPHLGKGSGGGRPCRPMCPPVRVDEPQGVSE